MFRDQQPCRVRDQQGLTELRRFPSSPQTPFFMQDNSWDWASGQLPTKEPLLVLTHLSLSGTELNRELVVLPRFHLDDQFTREMKGFDR